MPVFILWKVKLFLLDRSSAVRILQIYVKFLNVFCGSLGIYDHFMSFFCIGCKVSLPRW